MCFQGKYKTTMAGGTGAHNGMKGQCECPRDGNEGQAPALWNRHAKARKKENGVRANKQMGGRHNKPNRWAHGTKWFGRHKTNDGRVGWVGRVVVMQNEWGPQNGRGGVGWNENERPGGNGRAGGAMGGISKPTAGPHPFLFNFNLIFFNLVIIILMIFYSMSMYWYCGVFHEEHHGKHRYKYV